MSSSKSINQTQKNSFAEYGTIQPSHECKQKLMMISVKSIWDFKELKSYSSIPRFEIHDSVLMFTSFTAQ